MMYCVVLVRFNKAFNEILLLGSIARSIEKLSIVGILVKNAFGQFTIRAKIVMGVFDLPAKAAILCVKQYNGKYGFSVCLHSGKGLPNNARVYLPDNVYPKRNHGAILMNTHEAERTNTCIRGIIGVSPL